MYKITSNGAIFDNDLKTYFCNMEICDKKIIEYLAFNDLEPKYIYDCNIPDDEFVSIVDKKLMIHSEKIYYTNKRTIKEYMTNKLRDGYDNFCCSEHQLDNILMYYESVPEFYLDMTLLNNYIFEILKKTPSTFLLIPENLRDYRMCQYMSVLTPSAYSYIKNSLDKFIQAERDIILGSYVLTFPEGFYVIDNKYKTEIICVAAINNDISFYGMLTNHQKSRYITKIYLTTEENINMNLIPQKYFHNNDLFSELLLNNGLFLKHIPEVYKSIELCKLAIYNNCRAIDYVPQKFINTSFLNFVIKNTKSLEDCVYISLRINNTYLYLELIKQNNEYFDFFNQDFVTHEILVYILKACPTKIKNIDFKNSNILNLFLANMTTYIDILSDITFDNLYYAVEYIPTCIFSRDTAIYTICYNTALYRLKFSMFYCDDEFKFRIIKGGYPVYFFSSDLLFMNKIINNINELIKVRKDIIYELPEIYCNDILYLVCIEDLNFTDIPIRHRTPFICKTFYDRVIKELKNKFKYNNLFIDTEITKIVDIEDYIKEQNNNLISLEDITIE